MIGLFNMKYNFFSSICRFNHKRTVFLGISAFIQIQLVKSIFDNCEKNIDNIKTYDDCQVGYQNLGNQNQCCYVNREANLQSTGFCLSIPRMFNNVIKNTSPGCSGKECLKGSIVEWAKYYQYDCGNQFLEQDLKLPMPCGVGLSKQECSRYSTELINCCFYRFIFSGSITNKYASGCYSLNSKKYDRLVLSSLEILCDLSIYKSSNTTSLDISVINNTNKIVPLQIKPLANPDANPNKNCTTILKVNEDDYYYPGSEAIFIQCDNNSFTDELSKDTTITYNKEICDSQCKESVKYLTSNDYYCCYLKSNIYGDRCELLKSNSLFKNTTYYVFNSINYFTKCDFQNIYSKNYYNYTMPVKNVTSIDNNFSCKINNTVYDPNDCIKYNNETHRCCYTKIYYTSTRLNLLTNSNDQAGKCVLILNTLDMTNYLKVQSGETTMENICDPLDIVPLPKLEDKMIKYNLLLFVILILFIL